MAGVRDLSGEPYKSHREHHAAKARLEAAAPDLMDALVRVLTLGGKPDLSVKENRDSFDAAIRDGWKAIHKAEGR